MSIALTGLLVIQVYWISNSIRMKETAFTQGVEEAVTNVVIQLEKTESARRLRSYKASARLYRKIDSLNYLIDKRINDLTGSEPANAAKPKSQRKGISSEAKGWRTVAQLDTTISVKPEPEILPNDTSASIPPRPKPKTINAEEDPVVIRLSQKRQRIIEELMQKSHLYDIALQGFGEDFRTQAIEKILDPALLDSLLNLALEEKGIRTPFEFGVFDPVRDVLVIQKTGDYSEELLNQGFAITLFPNQTKHNPAYLAVYFPNEKRYIISQIWWLLIISGLFVLVIVILFYHTVSTIIRQKKLSDMKNDFINNMTHEFKTPVSTISLACEALCDKDVVNSADMARSYIRIISEENKRLGMMAEKILQASVIEKGQLQMKSEQCNMHEIISSAAQKTQLQVESRNGTLATEFLATDYIIAGDRMHLTNVILNLLDNALKYSPQNPTIKLSTENNHKHLVISCADKGIGISKADQDRIFEKLYRVSTGNIHDVKGFGLGLSYVKAVVEAHKGNISLQSELRKGSVFIIVLPIYSPGSLPD